MTLFSLETWAITESSPNTSSSLETDSEKRGLVSMGCAFMNMIFPYYIIPLATVQ